MSVFALKAQSGAQTCFETQGICAAERTGPWEVVAVRGSGEVIEIESGWGEGEHMVVCHVVLVAIVVELDVSLAVVGRVDIELVVEDVGTGVSRIDVGHEGW